MVEILKQGENVPMLVEEQVLIIFCGNEGLLDELPTDSLARFEVEFIEYMKTDYPDLIRTLQDQGKFSDELHAETLKAANAFVDRFKSTIS